MQNYYLFSITKAFNVSKIMSTGSTKEVMKSIKEYENFKKIIKKKLKYIRKFDSRIKINFFQFMIF